MFTDAGSIDCKNLDCKSLEDPFDNLYSTPSRLNKYIHGTTSEHDLAEKGTCVLSTIVKIVGKEALTRISDVIETDATACKKSKIEMECNNCFSFMFSSSSCDKERTDTLRNELIEILNHFFENVADSQVAYRCNIRKLIPSKKKEKRFSPTYEMTLQVTKLTHIYLLIIPICVQDDHTLLFHKSYGFIFDEKHHTLYTKTHKLFDSDSPANALVASKQWLVGNVLPKLKRYAESRGLDVRNGCLVDVDKFSCLYNNLKQKYSSYLIDIWTENTDPLKFVYEGIRIATYLLLLWEEERLKKNLQQKQSFIDLGCGNGLLVYVLTKEGHPGRGVDIVKRKMWDVYSDGIRLEKTSISPQNLTVDVDWIVGYHTNELTPWIPIIGARSSYTVKYFVLPGSFYDFDRKYDGGESSNDDELIYKKYLDYIVKIGTECGFNVEEDILKIPSKQRVCSIGQERTTSINNHTNIDNIVSNILKKNSSSVMLDEKNRYSLQEVNKDLKNCTQVDHRVKEKIIDHIIERLLLKENFEYKWEKEGNEERTSSGEKWSEWNAGDVITIIECAELFNKELVKKLKEEKGLNQGLKSLIKDNLRIFKMFEGGKFSLNDYRKTEVEIVGKKKIMMKTENRKQKACWFFTCHPQGCVLTAEKCQYAHGEKDKSAFTF